MGRSHLIPRTLYAALEAAALLTFLAGVFILAGAASGVL